MFCLKIAPQLLCRWPADCEAPSREIQTHQVFNTGQIASTAHCRRIDLQSRSRRWNGLYFSSSWSKQFKQRSWGDKRRSVSIFNAIWRFLSFSSNLRYWYAWYNCKHFVSAVRLKRPRRVQSLENKGVYQLPRPEYWKGQSDPWAL